MPNWCENKLTIKGEPYEIMDFYNVFVKNPLQGDISQQTYIDFNMVIPEPESHKMCDGGNYTKIMEYCKAHNLPDPFKWRIEHWGHSFDKVDTYELLPSLEDTIVVISFYTPWTCPQPIIEKLFEICGKQFPTLTLEFQHFEPGLQNCGRYDGEFWLGYAPEMCIMCGACKPISQPNPPVEHVTEAVS